MFFKLCKTPIIHFFNYLTIYWKNQYCSYQCDMQLPVMSSPSQITISRGVMW
jgi:hypothetical protein